MDLERICYGCFQEKPGDSPVCLHCGFSAEEEQSLLALPMGTVLHGRYLTGRVLGVGGFGITYLSWDLVLEIKVAVKEYLPSGLATRHADRYQVVLTGRRREDYENGMERFLEEARILARLQGTPNIVSVQDHFRENSTAYFVMEYVDGMSLKAYLASQGGRIPCGQALTILQPIMEALTRVHALGLTHRDISPDNVSITSGGESKLLDFGAARFSSGGETSVSVILKHGFAPEEQYSSHGSQGPWTDVYAMGATLYRCITGELPPDSIARAHSDTLKKPSELGVSLPEGVEAAILKAMAVKAENRYPSMEAFLQALRGADAAGPPPKAVKRRGSRRPEAGRAERRPARKSPARKIAALIVCAAAAGLGVWGLVTGNVPRTDGGQSGAPAPASGVEPGGTQPGRNDYFNESLNFSMRLPPDFQETDPGSAAFLSPDGSGSLQIGYYTYWSGFPVYSLADVEENAENYVRYFVGLLQSTDVTEYEILSREYRQIGGENSYQVQFEATESGGSTMCFLAAFPEGQNGFGCYNVIASYPEGDEALREELLSSVESFRCLGPAATRYRLFSDESLSFRFLYAQEDPPLRFGVENGVLTAASTAEGGAFTLTLSALPLAGGQTADDVLALATDGLDTSYPGVRQLGGQRTQESGGMQWSIRTYSHESEGVAVYLSYSVSVWQEKAYLLILSSDQETQLEENGFRADIMGSLRPAP